MLAATHGDLTKRQAELEEKIEALALNHGTFSRNTRAQLAQVFNALLELMTQPAPPKRQIAFIAREDKGKKTSSQEKRKTWPNTVRIVSRGIHQRGSQAPMAEPVTAGTFVPTEAVESACWACSRSATGCGHCDRGMRRASFVA